MHWEKAIKNHIKSLIPDGILTHKLPKRAGNSITLTFDDGPDATLTPLILNRLKDYNAKAIFFVIGKKAASLPHILEEIVSQGHVIGNHTYNHPARIISSAREYKKEIDRCSEVIAKNTGHKPILVRPPLGLACTSLIPSAYLRLKTVMWSIEGGEWGIHKNKKIKWISNKLVKNIKPQDIVLLHDNNKKVPEILDILLPHLRNIEIDLTSGIQHITK